MEKEIGLSGLIEKIKKDGIEEAEKKSQHIILQAEKKAHDIIAKAEGDSKSIIEEAGHEADRLRKQAEESVRQSIRDAILMLKQRAVDLFDAVLKRQAAGEISKDVLKEVIVKLIGNFKKDGMPDIEVLLSAKEKAELEKAVLNSLTEEMRKGVTFKVSPSVEKGFRIGQKGGDYYYDFTDEAVAEALRTYLNPKLVRIFDGK